ncbi:unnamed protein product [Moneuplotes crassus]|uniref:Uncharacterized protein n=1 Tax=Euplotes crassus TaxID=5936 RepID=A0AAD2D7G2_EUPCR|nr:unnamed protein product [Moneuplotes crassus]
MDYQRDFLSEVRESYDVLLSPHQNLDANGRVTRIALITKFKKRRNRTRNMRDTEKEINNQDIIRSLSKSKLLPDSDYKRGNYTGNTSYKPGDKRAVSPRRQRQALRSSSKRSSFFRGNTTPMEELIKYTQKDKKQPQDDSESELFTDSDLKDIEEEDNHETFEDISESNHFKKRSQTNVRFEFSPRIEIDKSSFKNPISPIPKHVKLGKVNKPLNLKIKANPCLPFPKTSRIQVQKEMKKSGRAILKKPNMKIAISPVMPRMKNQQKDLQQKMSISSISSIHGKQEVKNNSRNKSKPSKCKNIN